jgi:ankyrin repeat protein
VIVCPHTALLCSDRARGVCRVDEQGLTALHYAVSGGVGKSWRCDQHRDMLTLLIDAGADVNQMDNKGTHITIHNTYCSHKIAHWEANIAGVCVVWVESGFSAFHLACITRQAALASYLLARGADVVRTACPPLACGCQKRRAHVLPESDSATSFT